MSSLYIAYLVTTFCNKEIQTILNSTYLVILEKIQAEICEDHPNFLPPISILVFSTQVTTEAVLNMKRIRNYVHTYANNT